MVPSLTVGAASVAGTTGGVVGVIGVWAYDLLLSARMGETGRIDLEVIRTGVERRGRARLARGQAIIAR